MLNFLQFSKTMKMNPSFLAVLILVVDATAFCVWNDSPRSISAEIYEYTGSGAYKQSNIKPRTKSCCNPPSKGCYYQDSTEGSYQGENLVLSIKCNPDLVDGWQKVVGCGNCAFYIGGNGLITVSGEKDGIIRTVLACVGLGNGVLPSKP